MTGEDALPSLVVNSGYGLHAVYLLQQPAVDKPAWRKVQRGLVRKFAELGADKVVATDESRVLRLVPYPNRKRWPDGLETSILYQSEVRYTLAEFLAGFPVESGTAFSHREVIAFPLQPITDLSAEMGEQAAGDVDPDVLVARAGPVHMRGNVFGKLVYRAPVR